MPELPSGTVTFLFTDIEGSTRLWEQHPDAMADAVARHDALLRQAIEAKGGHVFKTGGDSFCAAFAAAPDALSAALAAQRALRDCGLRIADCGLDDRDAPSAPLTPASPIRNPKSKIQNPPVLQVRVALHTGAAQERDGDYFGAALSRVARLLAAAYGGQVLLSRATAAAAGQALPGGATLRDLGSHRLKDLQQPEQIFQLLHPDLPAEFPPLRSLEALAHNLPVQLTSFIGREGEMAEVKRLLGVGQAVSLPGAGDRPADRLPHCHLLTLTGSGGCGKTRLALQVAADLVEEYADGVWLVELAALADPALVLQTVASALGVREEPGRPMTQTVLDYLRSRSLLLVLDNCEHLLAACAQLAEDLLRRCLHLRILATSRAALGIAGETTYRVPSLSLPDPGQGSRVEGQGSMRTGRSAGHPPSTLDPQPSTLLQYEAAQLFIDRAAAAAPSFVVSFRNAPAVAQVCRRLDGIPLAIELAAARVRVLPVETINERLDDRFRLLTGGSRTALPRQQTLQALIDWSYDLLSEPERTLLRRLSVFAGGWTLEAAEAVCGDRMTNDQQGMTNVQCPMSNEGGRNIGHWTLDIGHSPSVGHWTLVEGDVLDLLTALVDQSLVSFEEQRQEARYRLLETVREYSRDRLLASGEAEGVRNRHLSFFLGLAERAEPELRGPHQGEWSHRLDVEYDNLRAALAWSVERGEAEQGLRLGEALWRFWDVRGYLSEGRERLVGLLALPDAPRRTEVRAKALHGAGMLAYSQADFSEARAFYEESLAIRRELGNEVGVAALLNSLGLVAVKQGESAAAHALHEESLAIFRELGERRGIAVALHNLGLVAYSRNDYAAARALLEESLALKQELGDKRGVGNSLHNLGELACTQGDYDAARSFLDDGLAIFREMEDKAGIARSLNHLGRVALCQDDWRRAAPLCRESLSLFRQLDSKDAMVECLEALGRVASGQGEPEHAARLFGAAEALRIALGAPMEPAGRAEYDRVVAATRAALNEEVWVAAWAKGRAMTLEEAISASAVDEGTRGGEGGPDS